MLRSCSGEETTPQNWIWTEKLRPGTKCRKGGAWWPETKGNTGKGKGYGRPVPKQPQGTKQTWPEAPPGLTKFKPLKRTKVQQEASILGDVQDRLQAIGIGPTKPEEPELTDLLKTHMPYCNKSW